MQMTPGLWLGLLGSLSGVVFLVGTKADAEAESDAKEEANVGWSQSDSRTAIAVRSKHSGRRRTQRPAQVLFVNDPDKFQFFEDQFVGASGEARAMFEVWKKARTRRESLQEGGLGVKHPEVIALGDREVLLGNRLNQELRNESRESR